VVLIFERAFIYMIINSYTWSISLSPSHATWDELVETQILMPKDKYIFLNKEHGGRRRHINIAYAKL